MVVVFVDNILAGGDLVVDRVEADRDGNQDSSYGQGVEEGR